MPPLLNFVIQRRTWLGMAHVHCYKSDNLAVEVFKNFLSVCLFVSLFPASVGESLSGTDKPMHQREMPLSTLSLFMTRTLEKTEVSVI